MINFTFINPETEEVDPRQEQPASYLRKVFSLREKPVSAKLSITALGVYKAWMNGRELDQQILLPGFTDYRKRVQYQSYEVADFLEAGKNVIACVLGDGWYRGVLGAFNKRNVYGTKTALAGKLEILYADGKKEEIVTDESWKATQNGPLRENNIKTIERYDARMEMSGWKKSGFDESGWHACKKTSYDGIFVEQEGERVLEHERFTPSILHTPDGSTVLDFGQNLAGHVWFRVNGPEGIRVSLTMGETLDEDGNFTLKNLEGTGRSAKVMGVGQRLEYILKEGEQEYRSYFLISGYRYVKIEGWPEEVRPENFRSIAVYSDLKETGSFSCSEPLVNRLVENVRWSMKSNFVDIPTDCPQRERAGWAGDINVFNETADYLADTRKFLNKWMHDFEGMQQEDGGLPYIVPYVPMVGVMDSSSGWSDAILTVPMMQYWFYGDIEILREAYPYAKKWVEFNVRRAENRNPLNFFKKWFGEKYILDTGFHFGEWLEPDGNNLKDGLKAFAHPDYEVATAWFYYSAKLLSEMAGLLGEKDDQEKYKELSSHIRKAYRLYLMPKRNTPGLHQCRYVRPLYMGLADAGDASDLARWLDQKVRMNNYKIGTGFLTTYQILNVLTDYGYVETAYHMLENEECPGWLYEVKKGATSIWEGWEAIDKNGKINTLSMNHYAPGAVVSWLFSRCAGIRPLSPGFKEILIRPYPGGNFQSAEAEFMSVAGLIKSSWRRDEDEFKLEVIIPEEADARIELPDGSMINHAKSGVYSCTLKRYAIQDNPIVSDQNK